jgi:hypothetical protein
MQQCHLIHCTRNLGSSCSLPAVGAGDCYAGRNVRTIRRRYRELCAAAASHPAWGQQWGGYKPGSIASLLTYPDARQARLALLIERGWQGSYSMRTVLGWTDTRWAEALQKLARQGGAPGVQQLQHCQVRQLQWVRGQHCGALTPCISLVCGRQQQTRGHLPPACRRPLLLQRSRRPRGRRAGGRSRRAASTEGGAQQPAAADDSAAGAGSPARGGQVRRRRRWRWRAGKEAP